MSASYILVVDDEPDIRESVKEILEDEGYQVATASCGETAKTALRERLPDLVLLDIWMPDLDGITLLKEWSASGGLPAPVVMMSGHGTVETAVEATHLGAYDFLEKPLSLAKLILTVERALEQSRLVKENVVLKSKAEEVIEPVGHSSVIHRLREQVKRVARHDTWVLISGEKGTGRETFARYLHSSSPRKSREFVEVNAGLISNENAGLGLFGGEVDGVITYGKMEQASGGTLYLDEVSDMTLAAQAQLVAALDTGSFLRVGGVDPIEVDVRIVAATQKDLRVEVNAGRFREDLFFHLNVVPLQIPSLRNHNEDVPDLVSYYVDYFIRNEGFTYHHFSTAAQNFLRNYVWPGNVFELKNLVQRMMILARNEEIELDEVESTMGMGAIVIDTPVDTGIANLQGISFDQPLRQAREDFERVYLEFQLEKNQGNVSQMAKEVGMERTHLYRKLRSVGIEIKDRKSQ